MTKEPRMNLKELRDTLNKIQTKHLESFAITTDFCTEDPEGKFDTIFKMNDDATDDEKRELYGSEELKEIRERLLAPLNKEAIQLVTAQLDEEQFERFSEDIEPDW